MLCFEKPTTNLIFWTVVSILVFIYLIYNHNIIPALFVLFILTILIVLYIEEERLEKCRKNCNSG